MTEWRVVTRFPNYEVSERGAVRTRFKTATRSAGRVLKGSIKFGYQRYDLWHGDRQHCVGAHGLVCEAWHGPAPSSEHVPAHWDGDRLNNHFDNLRWATPRENAQDKIRHGRSLRGEDNPHAKLSNADVIAIRSSITGRRGEQKELAERYGVSEGRISILVHQPQVAALRASVDGRRGHHVANTSQSQGEATK
jgi:hypothetical protein